MSLASTPHVLRVPDPPSTTTSYLKEAIFSLDMRPPCKYPSASTLHTEIEVKKKRKKKEEKKDH